MDWDAEHILLRTVRCVSGTVELVMELRAVVRLPQGQRELGVFGAVATARRSRGPTATGRHPTLRLTTNLRIGLESREARARTE